MFILQVNSASVDAGSLATDVAMALVRKGVAFRTAHHAVGACLRRAKTLNLDLQSLPYDEYMKIW